MTNEAYGPAAYGCSLQGSHKRTRFFIVFSIIHLPGNSHKEQAQSLLHLNPRQRRCASRAWNRNDVSPARLRLLWIVISDEASLAHCRHVFFTHSHPNSTKWTSLLLGDFTVVLLYVRWFIHAYRKTTFWSHHNWYRKTLRRKEE